MNPSTNGWIEKLHSQFSNGTIPYESFDLLYSNLKSFGFIYGVNVGITDKVETNLTYSEDELAKINLLTGFYHIRYFFNSDFSASEFISELLGFYKTLEIADLSRIAFA